MAELTLCQKLGAALSDMVAEKIPGPVMHAAKRALLDALGAGLAGSSTKEVELLLRAHQGWHEQGNATIWARSERLTAPHAALVNGTAVHAREVDDFGGCGHSGAVVIPAVLAAAELSPCSGRNLLAAIAVGYEAAARVIDLVGGYAVHNAEGWHGTGTCGVFGAAAGASHILGLSSKQIAHALALAGTYTGGIWSFIADGAMSKRLHAGKAAEGGLVAACLARVGMTGPLHVFESDWGSFASLYGREHAAPESLLRSIGAEFLIFRSGFKPYACCRGCHSSVDAVLQLRQIHQISPPQVDHIRVYSSEQTARQLGKREVGNLLDAQMSLPYSIAVSLTAGRADLEHFQPPYLNDEAIKDLAARVAVIGEASRALGSQPTVEIHLRSGQVLSASVQHAKGELKNPMSDQELNAKFLSLSRYSISEDRAEQLRTLVWRIDRESSTEELIHLLAQEEVQ